MRLLGPFREISVDESRLILKLKQDSLENLGAVQTGAYEMGF